MLDKSEIKRNYKQTLTPMGVYQLKNLVNGKILIGSSKNLPGRKNRFNMELEYGNTTNKELLKDIEEFGKENFQFEVLDYLEPKEDPLYNYTEDLRTLEELWIEKLQPFDDKGYNKPVRK